MLIFVIRVSPSMITVGSVILHLCRQSRHWLRRPGNYHVLNDFDSKDFRAQLWWWRLGLHEAFYPEGEEEENDPRLCTETLIGWPAQSKPPSIRLFNPSLVEYDPPGAPFERFRSVTPEDHDPDEYLPGAIKAPHMVANDPVIAEETVEEPLAREEHVKTVTAEKEKRKAEQTQTSPSNRPKGKRRRQEETYETYEGQVEGQGTTSMSMGPPRMPLPPTQHGQGNPSSGPSQVVSRKRRHKIVQEDGHDVIVVDDMDDDEDDDDLGNDGENPGGGLAAITRTGTLLDMPTPSDSLPDNHSQLLRSDPKLSAVPWSLTVPTTLWDSALQKTSWPKAAKRSFKGNSCLVRHVALSPRGAKWVVAVGDGEMVIVWGMKDLAV